MQANPSRLVVAPRVRRGDVSILILLKWACNIDTGPLCQNFIHYRIGSLQIMSSRAPAQLLPEPPPLIASSILQDQANLQLAD